MQTNPNALDWSLHDVHIIEASAGTGKTYNIQTLFARQIIEKAIPVNSILVVTFTEAATKELIDRIRRILKNLLHYVKSGENLSGENRIPEIIQKASTDKSFSHKMIRQRIDKALKNFDDAAIYTIHGFCNRMLEDAAFETGALFNTELIEDTDEILADVMADFFRENFYNQSIFTNKLLQAQGITLDRLTFFVKNVNESLDPVFLPKDIQMDLGTDNIKKGIERIKKCWDRKEILEELSGKMKAAYQNGKLNKKINKIEKLIDGVITGDTLDTIAKFTNETIANEVYAKFDKKDFPSHKFFDLCDEISAAIDNFTYAVKLKGYQYYLKEFKQHKQEKNIKTYDDMIDEVRRKVSDPDNNHLKKYIQERYEVAMVDEFQDTSPAQYEIFKNVFIDGGHPVYFVGDPKQAIYKFRGGDIYTYNKAKKRISKNNHHNLNKNWRSLPNLVSVFNFLFSDEMGEYPFANEFIKYTPVDSRAFNKDDFLTYLGEQEKSPFKILFKDEKTGTAKMMDFACKQTAARIYQLLNNNDYQIGRRGARRPLKPEDIAILVDKHARADRIKEELKKWNIPVTVQATGNVFSTDEARDMQLLISAISDPGDLQKARALLTRKLFDQNCQQLMEMSLAQESTNQEEFEEYLNLIRTSQKIWRENNFVEMLTFLMDEIELKQRFLSYYDGERILTNFLHLSELIHKQEEQSGRGMDSIQKWFDEKYKEASRGDEEEKLRLETDRSAVRVMTVHRSKGLEFPIVFCPFLWAKTVYLYNQQPKFHDDEGNYYIDLEGSSENKNYSRDENLEELMRLLYVALTRAESQCYVIWGKLLGQSGSKKKKSSIAYLFHRDKLESNSLKKGEIAAALGSKIKSTNYKPDKIKLCEHIKLENNLGDDPDIHRYEIERPELMDDIIDFSGNTEISWKVSSFSSLIEHDQSAFHEYFDYDSIDNEKIALEDQESPEYNIFDFPGGVKTGNCWHKIFEEIDFQAEDDEIYEIVIEKLQLYNLIQSPAEDELRKSKIDAVYNMVESVLQASLNAPGLSLDRISCKNKIAEMEFSLSLGDEIEMEKFNSVLKDYGYQIELQQDIPEGMLKGFIDLVFRNDGKYYILDWKSNKIGNSYDDYVKDHLEREMHKNNYHLQYLLYTIALVKYLQKRNMKFDYESMFGGVYYLFLRGINTRLTGNGIYFNRPEHELVEELLKFF